MPLGTPLMTQMLAQNQIKKRYQDPNNPEVNQYGGMQSATPPPPSPGQTAQGQDNAQAGTNMPGAATGAKPNAQSVGLAISQINKAGAPPAPPPQQSLGMSNPGGVQQQAGSQAGGGNQQNGQTGNGGATGMGTQGGAAAQGMLEGEYQTAKKWIDTSKIKPIGLPGDTNINNPGGQGNAGGDGGGGGGPAPQPDPTATMTAAEAAIYNQDMANGGMSAEEKAAKTQAINEAFDRQKEVNDRMAGQLGGSSAKEILGSAANEYARAQGMGNIDTEAYNRQMQQQQQALTPTEADAQRQSQIDNTFSKAQTALAAGGYTLKSDGTVLDKDGKTVNVASMQQNDPAAYAAYQQYLYASQQSTQNASQTTNYQATYNKEYQALKAQGWSDADAKAEAKRRADQGGGQLSPGENPGQATPAPNYSAPGGGFFAPGT